MSFGREILDEPFGRAGPAAGRSGVETELNGRLRPVTFDATPTMESKLYLFFDGLTDVGLRRLNNEDAWWIGELGGRHCFMEPGLAPLHVLLGSGGAPALLLVSDGVGGANAGEVASQMAVNSVSRELFRAPAALADAQTARQAIRAALQAANTAIIAQAASPEFDGMGATLSLLCFAGAREVCWVSWATAASTSAAKDSCVRSVATSHRWAGCARRARSAKRTPATIRSATKSTRALGNRVISFGQMPGSKASSRATSIWSALTA